jgi:hypothetical protein
MPILGKEGLGGLLPLGVTALEGMGFVSKGVKWNRSR